MTHYLLNADDDLERQNEKLLQITEALMSQVEQQSDRSGAAYAQFERAALLEEEVRERTQDLEKALSLLNTSNAQLAEANREAEQARANLANAIETIREGFALFNAQDELVMCNSRFGMHMAEVRIALRPGLSFGAYIDVVSRSRALALGKNDTPASWRARRLGHHRSDHSVFNVELSGDRWVQVSEQRTENGGTVVMQTDITDVIRLEREERGKLLDDQARMISATLDHIDQGVCIFDNKGRLRGWNTKIGTMLSVPAQQFRLGAEFAVLLHGISNQIAFRDGMTEAQLLAWADGGTKRPPFRFEIAHGAARLQVFCQEMPDGGFVISFADITRERVAAEALAEANESLEQRVRDRTLELEDALEAAERANASKTRFVAAASHDLLQPLSAAKLYMSSLVDTLPDPGEREVARKSLGAMRSVEHIIEALLDISKLDSEHATADVHVFSLDRILEPLENEFAPIAALKGLDLAFHRSTETVRSDPTYLRRILQNLTSNAIRYTDRGYVAVEARADRRTVVLSVRDTGPGIAEEDQARIFEEFQRLNAKASASDGMGLGLAIVDRACAFLGHPLELRSTLGQGCTFSVTVPRASSPVRRG